MSEHMTAALVLDELTRLFTAFPTHAGMKNNPRGTAEVYRNGLTGISGDALRHAAKRVIQEDSFFPKVARLREIALGWETYTRAANTAPAGEVDPLWCPRCQSRVETVEWWRPAVGRRPDGQPDFRDICRNGFV